MVFPLSKPADFAPHVVAVESKTNVGFAVPDSTPDFRQFRVYPPSPVVFSANFRHISFKDDWEYNFEDKMRPLHEKLVGFERLYMLNVTYSLM